MPHPVPCTVRLLPRDFTFWAVLPHGTSEVLSTASLFSAQRTARQLGARKLFVHNPGNRIVSELTI